MSQLKDVQAERGNSLLFSLLFYPALQWIGWGPPTFGGQSTLLSLPIQMTEYGKGGECWSCDHITWYKNVCWWTGAKDAPNWLDEATCGLQGTHRARNFVGSTHGFQGESTQSQGLHSYSYKETHLQTTWFCVEADSSRCDWASGGKCSLANTFTTGLCNLELRVKPCQTPGPRDC